MLLQRHLGMSENVPDSPDPLMYRFDMAGRSRTTPPESLFPLPSPPSPPRGSVGPPQLMGTLQGTSSDRQSSGLSRTRSVHRRSTTPKRAFDHPMNSSAFSASREMPARRPST